MIDRFDFGGVALGLSLLTSAPVLPAPQTRGAQTPATTQALVESFERENSFWRQFAIATQIADRNDPSVLPALVKWLRHEDRHLRGNAAFVFARLGDPRGFPTIADILADRSERPEGQGIPTAPGDGRYRYERQVAADRYYAAHLLGDLRDPRGIPLLVPLLRDREVQAIVPWSLSQIGGKGAIGPLLEVLDEDDPSMRVLAIFALETLRAAEAMPRLIQLLDDDRRSNFADQVSVADAARRALAKLK